MLDKIGGAVTAHVGPLPVWGWAVGTIGALVGVRAFRGGSPATKTAAATPTGIGNSGASQPGPDTGLPGLLASLQQAVGGLITVRNPFSPPPPDQGPPPIIQPPPPVQGPPPEQQVLGNQFVSYPDIQGPVANPTVLPVTSNPVLQQEGVSRIEQGRYTGKPIPTYDTTKTPTPGAGVSPRVAGYVSASPQKPPPTVVVPHQAVQ